MTDAILQWLTGPTLRDVAYTGFDRALYTVFAIVATWAIVALALGLLLAPYLLIRARLWAVLEAAYRLVVRLVRATIALAHERLWGVERAVAALRAAYAALDDGHLHEGAAR